MKPTARQVTLFKSAPREYVNLSIDPPVVAAYYIDEGFYTTWVIRSKTKFQDFDGKSGLKFTISDYQFFLPQVEAVSSNELVDSFRETGAAVDLILGQDFINTYSFLFYKRSNNGLQLSKSCVNRTIWPAESGSHLDFYTEFYLKRYKGGVAAYTNICSPFNIWRPYKPSYWDPREDIGLFAMTLAMRVATQMSISGTAPIIHLISSDKYTCERFSPFLGTKYEDLDASKDFKSLKILPMKRNVILFLKYRKNYANRNGLNELSCVYIDSHRVAENTKYAKDLAKLGAEMSQLHFKGELSSQPTDGQYYHFDSHLDVFTLSKKESNITLKRILETYQEQKNVQKFILKSASNDRAPTDKTPITIHKVPIANNSTQKTLVKETPIISSLPKKTTSTKELPIAQPTETHSKTVYSTCRPNNSLFSEILIILDQVKTGKIMLTKKDLIFCEINSKLQEMISKEWDNASKAISSQRQKCDLIIAGAYQKYDESIEIVKQAARLQGYLEGFFDGNNYKTTCTQRAPKNPTQEIEQNSDDSIGHTSIKPVLAENTVNSLIITTTPTKSTDIAITDAKSRYEHQRLAIEKLRLDGKLPIGDENCNGIITPLKCRFSKSGKVGDILHAEVEDVTLKIDYTENYNDDKKHSLKPPESTRDIGVDLVPKPTTKARSESAIDRQNKKGQYNHSTEKNHNVGLVDDYKLMPKSKPAPLINLPEKQRLALSNGYSNIKVYSCLLPPLCPRKALSPEGIRVPETQVINPPKKTIFVNDSTNTSQLDTTNCASSSEVPTDRVTHKQRAQMTNVSGRGVEESLESPIITLEQALEASPYLRKTLSTLLCGIRVNVDILKNDMGLKCVCVSHDR